MNNEEIEELKAYIADLEVHILQSESILSKMRTSLVEMKKLNLDQAKVAIDRYESTITHLTKAIDRWKFIRQRSANRLANLKSFE